MEVYRGNKGRAPLVPNFRNRFRCMVNFMPCPFTPGTESPYPLNTGAVWATGLILMLWRRENISPVAGIEPLTVVQPDLVWW